jgi:hypothetical protein
MTDKNPLDLFLLADAWRAIADAQRFTAAGEATYDYAVLRARDALNSLALALAQHDRKELLGRLLSDVEPRLSPDRDHRSPELEP